MKIKFIKKYKKFQKDDIAVIHWTDANKLIKKGVAESTDIITEEDKVLKQFLSEEDNGNNG